MITSLKDFQRYCLKHKVTFVSYVMPGEKEPVTLWCTKPCETSFRSIDEIDFRSGFLFSPFQSESCPVVVIPDNDKNTGWEFNINAFPAVGKSSETSSGTKELNISTYEEYVAQIEDIRQTLANGKARKVVLSRIKSLKNIEPELLPDVFEAMVSQYTHAFVYLLYTPETGIWLGATPESLIRIEQQRFSTMALAGTKAFAEESKQVEWTEKEIKEQEYVVRHVRQRLMMGGYSFDESPRQTVRAANVMHLRTMFSGKLNDNNVEEWKNLVGLLYPTPAICGTDAETTLQVIQQAEKHKREYYTGILGPFNAGAETHLFINLRCMKIVDRQALLFAGGGILGESSAQKEWEETELKFDTLIQVIQQVMVKAYKPE